MKLIGYFRTCKAWRICFGFIALLFSAAPAWAATVDGLVTKIDSPTAFDVGTLHVMMDTTTQCDVKTAYTLKASAYPFGSIPAPYGQWRTSKSITTATQSCDALHLVVGLRIHLAGTIQKNGQFRAAQAVVYRIVPSKNIDGAALIENTPEVRQDNHGWNGTFWINGYPMTVVPQTKVLSAPSSTTFRYGLHLLHWKGSLWIHAKVASAPAPKSFSVDPIKTNAWATYHATRALDGTITARQFRFWPNHVGAKEKAYLEKTTTVIHAPDYSRHIPGKVQLKDGEAAEIFPDQKVQDFVSRLGMEVVPQYQKYLSSADATKINFRFYVVPNWTVNPGNGLLNLIDGGLYTKCNIFTCTSSALRFIAPIKYIVAMPDGIILVSDSTLAVLQNKAQLAALLSYAVTSIVQKQAYVAWPFIMRMTKHVWNSTGATAVAVGGLHALSLGVWLNEQVLRIGIRQMYLAGYDIREAPFAWAVARGKPVNNPIINSKHPDKEIPWYAAYAFNYISHYYSDVDYSKLKRGEKEYQQFLQELYKADPSLPHPKVAAAATK